MSVQRGPRRAQFRTERFATKSFGTASVQVPTSRGTRKGRAPAAHNKETFMVPWSGGRSLCADVTCNSAPSIVRSIPVVIQHQPLFHWYMYLLRVFPRGKFPSLSHTAFTLSLVSLHLHPKLVVVCLTYSALLKSGLESVISHSTNMDVPCLSDFYCIFLLQPLL